MLENIKELKSLSEHSSIKRIETQLKRIRDLIDKEGGLRCTQPEPPSKTLT